MLPLSFHSSVRSKIRKLFVMQSKELRLTIFLLESILVFNLGCNRRVIFRLPRVPGKHGSSEGYEMLKRSDKYHSIADDVPIPKM